MSRYDEVRLRGNPLAAFAIDRAEGPRPQRPLSPGAPGAREEEARAEAARRERMQAVRERRLEYRSDTEFFTALRAAQAGEDFELPEGENR
jgi:hypothetical protein